MIFDLQVLTVYRAVAALLPSFKGDVLDVGSGQSPYRFLLDATRAKYHGIDIRDAGKFDYHNSDITVFNGEDIPFEAEKFEGVICTEVLEHVQNYQKLVDEIHRVMKQGAVAVITVPWSARYHYIPYDYFRYTPSSLRAMFSSFRQAKIANRGTDVVTIASKIIVLWFRNLLPDRWWRYPLVPLWVLCSPLLLIVILIAHASLWWGIGSDDDPLGYTIVATK
jgi:ubiquinone/menaquinone biosynthesis C-methylase UbiE